MMTENEKKVLKLLFTAFEDYSINEIARKCNLAPNGALKILEKFEKEGILNARKIANIKAYRINFKNEKAKSILELALIPELKGKIKFRLEDLKLLKTMTKACIIFGSYLDKKDPNDIDILFILDKENFKEYKNKNQGIFRAVPVKVHDVLQTEEDFKKNITKKDKVLIEIVQKGVILWGQRKIIELIEHGHQR